MASTLVTVKLIFGDINKKVPSSITVDGGPGWLEGRSGQVGEVHIGETGACQRAMTGPQN